MNSRDFVQWLRGFVDGVHDFNVTPKQWDLLKEKLEAVNDNEFVEPPGMFEVHPEPPYPGVIPFDRYPWGGQIVWAGTPYIPESGSISTAIGTTTLGISGSYICTATTVPKDALITYTTTKDILHD